MYNRRTSRKYYGDKQGNKSVKFHSGGSHVSANGHVPHAIFAAPLNHIKLANVPIPVSL